ncbi:MAG: hypothetical protein ACE5HP_10435 [Gemmatimonadota bacterium]
MKVSGRARLGLGILVLWVATLGWHVKRQYFRPLTEVIASGARMLPPGTSYYTVLRQDRQVGWAQSRVDTLPGGEGFLLEERLELRLPELGGSGAAGLSTRAELGPSLSLRRFAARTAGVLGAVSVEGEVIGDSLLRARTTRDGPPDAVTAPLDGPVVLSSAVALRLAAEGSLRPGDRLRLPILDPLSLELRPVELRVIDEAIRTYPDSATTDDTGRWLPARTDTVRAWLVEQELRGVRLRSWVDEDGRLLEARTIAGLRLERTAFELAYFPYRELTSPARESSPVAPRERDGSGG